MIKINEECADKKSELDTIELINEIDALRSENTALGRKLAVLYNVVEISTYINSFISQDNIIQLINDMIIGILGVKYSTIYLTENNELKIKATNAENEVNTLDIESLNYIDKGQAFIINSKESLSNCVNDEIYSRMGIPIKVGERVIGYIIGEHTHYEYFNDDHKMFIGAVANHVAIALENAVLYRKLEQFAKLDPLLSIYNRRTFFELVEEKLQSKVNNDFAIVMIDLDNFKSVNDTLGHQVGDEVLRQTARILRTSICENDILGRYGGEEIIIYIDDVSKPYDVFEKIDSIREAIENNKIKLGSEFINITASFGLSFSYDKIHDLKKIIKEADGLLYKAKYNGKNRVASSLQ